MVLISVSIGAGAFYLKHRDDPPPIGEFDLTSWPTKSRAWSEAALNHKDWRVRWSAALVLGRSEAADTHSIVGKATPRSRNVASGEAAAEGVGAPVRSSIGAGSHFSAPGS